MKAKSSHSWPADVPEARKYCLALLPAKRIPKYKRGFNVPRDCTFIHSCSLLLCLSLRHILLISSMLWPLPRADAMNLRGAVCHRRQTCGNLLFGDMARIAKPHQSRERSPEHPTQSTMQNPPSGVMLLAISLSVAAVLGQRLRLVQR